LTPGKNELAFVVMQCDHEKEMELRDAGSSRQESTELALMKG
jgi:hypothetical protein